MSFFNKPLFNLLRVSIVAIAFGYLPSLQAQTLEQKVDNLAHQMLNVLRRLDNLEAGNGGGGGGNHESVDITSSVEVDCISRKWEATSYATATAATAVVWAEACRDAPKNQEGCLILSSTSQQVCFQKARQIMSYASLTEVEADSIETACKTVKLRCSF